MADGQLLPGGGGQVPEAPAFDDGQGIAREVRVRPGAVYEEGVVLQADGDIGDAVPGEGLLGGGPGRQGEQQRRRRQKGGVPLEYSWALALMTGPTLAWTEALAMTGMDSCPFSVSLAEAVPSALRVVWPF